MRRFDEQDPFELLGVAPDATPEEIRRAFEHLSVLLAPGSLALYSAAELDEQHQLQQRLRAAYLTVTGRGASAGETLSGADELAPAPGAPVSVEPPAGPSSPASPVPSGGPSMPRGFSGPVLRELREAAGMSLRVLSERTRIRPQQLTHIEEEAWDALPPRVYVRGFVMAYGRELKLDPNQVWTAFLERWRAARPTGE